MICRQCGATKAEEDFRMSVNGSRNPYRMTVCRSCEKERHYAAWRAKEAQECHICKEIKPIGEFAIRAYRCRDCHRERAKSRTRSQRQQQRARDRARRGKLYQTTEERWPWWSRLGRGYAGGINLRAHGWRSRRPPTIRAQWIDRLRIELPALYDPRLAPDTLEFRARYHLDSEFKAQQIRRAHKRRSDEEHGLFFDDGTLTGPVIRRLFGDAQDCPYCGVGMCSDDKTLDHVWPRSKGGWHSIHNAVVCCYSCNSKKHGNSPRRWLSRLPIAKRVSVIRLWRKAGVNVDQGYLIAI